MLYNMQTWLSVYVDEKRLESFMTEIPIQEPVHWFAEQINGLVSIRQEPPSWKNYSAQKMKFSIKDFFSKCD